MNLACGDIVVSIVRDIFNVLCDTDRAVRKSRFSLQRFWSENLRGFEKLTRLINFSQTGGFREAKASESGGASCVYQECRNAPIAPK
jgi:hypothetical protein